MDSLILSAALIAGAFTVLAALVLAISCKLLKRRGLQTAVAFFFNVVAMPGGFFLWSYREITDINSHTVGLAVILGLGMLAWMTLFLIGIGTMITFFGRDPMLKLLQPREDNWRSDF